jgi:hypothetical protein
MLKKNVENYWYRLVCWQPVVLVQGSVPLGPVVSVM